MHRLNWFSWNVNRSTDGMSYNRFGVRSALTDAPSSPSHIQQIAHATPIRYFFSPGDAFRCERRAGKLQSNGCGIRTPFTLFHENLIASAAFVRHRPTLTLNSDHRVGNAFRCCGRQLNWMRIENASTIGLHRVWGAVFPAYASVYELRRFRANSTTQKGHWMHGMHVWSLDEPTNKRTQISIVFSCRCFFHCLYRSPFCAFVVSVIWLYASDDAAYSAREQWVDALMNRSGAIAIAPYIDYRCFHRNLQHAVDEEVVGIGVASQFRCRRTALQIMMYSTQMPFQSLGSIDDGTKRARDFMSFCTIWGGRVRSSRIHHLKVRFECAVKME